jgi:hypothetical protein
LQQGGRLLKICCQVLLNFLVFLQLISATKQHAVFFPLTYEILNQFGKWPVISHSKQLPTKSLSVFKEKVSLKSSKALDLSFEKRQLNKFAGKVSISYT